MVIFVYTGTVPLEAVSLRKCKQWRAHASNLDVLCIMILMFYFDNKKHSLPHIHAQYAEHEAIVGIDDGEVLEGSLPRPKMRLVQAWIEIHREDLLAKWRLAVEGQQPFKIEPLK